MSNDNQNARPKHDRLIRLPELMNRVGFGRSTIYSRMAAGTFPRQVELGGNVVAWYESEIDDWINARPRRVAA